MSEILARWLVFDASQSVFAAAIAWIVRSTVVVGFAWIISRLAKRWSSDFRRGVWICAFAALAFVALQTATNYPLSLQLRIVATVQPNEAVNSGDRHGLTDPSLEIPGALPSVNTVGSAETLIKAGFATAVERPATDGESTLRSIPEVNHGWSYVVVLSCAYSLGIFAWLTRIIVSLIRLTRHARTSRPFPNRLSELARACGNTLHISRMPDCRISVSVSAPLTFGLLRPVVLVPPQFERLTTDQQRHCLLHEFAHVAHRDSWWNLLVEFTTAVYWFHPLVHVARSKMRRAREDAADDAVMRSGEDAISYSHSLVELARRTSFTGESMMAAVSSATNLELRIRRVLRPSLILKKQPRWLMVIVSIGFVLLSFVELAAKNADAQTPAQGADRSPDAVTAPVQRDEQPSVRTSREAASLHERFRTVTLHKFPDGVVPRRADVNFMGQVSDGSGPIANAVVLVRECVVSSGSEAGRLAPPIVARSITGPDGRYRIDGVPVVQSKEPLRTRWEILVGDPQGRLGLGVFGPNAYEIRKARYSNPREEIEAAVDIKLSNPDDFSGRVVGTEGEAIPNVSVAVRGIAVPNILEMDLGPFVPRGKVGSPRGTHVFRFPSDKVRLVARTDSGGRFSFRSSKNASLALGLQVNGWFPRSIRLTAKNHLAVHSGRSAATELASPARIELRKLLKVAVKVVDSEGAAVTDFKIRVSTPQTSSVAYTWMKVVDEGTLLTTAEFLRESVDVDGRIEMIVEFPFESGLLPTKQKVRADDLIANRSQHFVARKGIRVVGRVVNIDDGTGVFPSWVTWHRQQDEIAATLYQASAGKQGDWKMVVPKENAYLTVAGQMAGMDLGSIARLNKEPSFRKRFTQRIDVGDIADFVVPDFEIERISERGVTVVDAEGRPVKNVIVSATCIETVLSEGKSYLLRQALAESRRTDANGRCSLAWNRSKWEHGQISASEVLIDEEDRMDPRVIAGKTSVFPDSIGPIKLVLRDQWVISGRVLIDGKPATDIDVALTTRRPDTQKFGWVYDTQPIGNDGRFEIKAVAGDEYAVGLIRRSRSGNRGYFSQDPVTKVAEDRFEAKAISITNDQLK